MPTNVPATDLLPRPTRGRVFSLSAAVRLGDVDRNGRLRLDATARFMQDAATDDATDAQLDRRFGWLVRRTKIVTTTPAGLGEDVELSTWCTGIGRSWAERRTQIVGARGARIEAVSLWVQIDTATGRPARIADDFIEPYGEAANGRTISARLSLPPPGQVVATIPWSVRRSDLDPFGHVNNAATWSLVEEAACLDESDRRGAAELEYPLAIEPDVPVDIAVSRAGGTTSLWATGSDEEVLAAGCWSPVSAA